MSKQNTAEAVSTRIDTLLKKKREEVERVEKNITVSEKALNEAREKVRKATEITDLKEYEAAKKEEEKALTAFNMYRGRLSQIKDQGYVTDQESENVIRSLREYEMNLTRDFINAVSSHYDELKTLLNQYFSDLDGTETVISRWDSDIHQNYRIPGCIFSETGTDRAARPIPLKRWNPCAHSDLLKNFLETWENEKELSSNNGGIEEKQAIGMKNGL